MNKEELKALKKQETEKQWLFFLQIWKTVEKKCQSCGRNIYGPPKPLYFDHLLEKNKYPEFRFERENMYICCGDCHAKKNIGNPTAKHKLAIQIAETKFLNKSI